MSFFARKNVFIFILCVFLVILSGCGNNKTEAKEISSPEKTLENYLTTVKNKDIDEAYSFLDKNSLPERDFFEQSLEEQPLNDFSILRSKQVNDTSYKVEANLNAGGYDNKKVFILSKIEGQWFISLNTDKTKGNIDF
ncbi:hypothetical protein [Paenibacillus sp. FSL L8-0506]|jgi:hypothetical protein|uniref:hypothetical protein n=1 Tax=Paenibacillus sp. FSL L8-0506 TaxID=2975335 RepID=UPI0030FB06E7